MDMHSGGGQKLAWSKILIEAPEKEAELIFQNRFGRNPHRVTCTCCGNDYSLSESDSLEEATAFDRGCAYAYFDKSGEEVPEREAWVSGKGLQNGAVGRYVERHNGKSYSKYLTLEQYLASEKVLVIQATDIKPEERGGELHSEGYVWAD